ncbi:MAG: outer membrane protein assembly factor BamB [Proteobacteria bacterium]|nr:outer membrane protein assembly factor BamB [Pseudomonadota bacterium]
MKHYFRVPAIVLLAAGLVAACSKDKAVDAPAKLTALNPSLRVEHLWDATVDDKKAVALRLGLELAVDGDVVYAAGHKGEVLALQLKNGRTVWRTRLKAPLSGGAAVGGGLVVVGTSDGRVFALNQADGKPRWDVRINGEVLAPAAISARLVVVRTGDGKLRGLSPADGHELWNQEQQVPRLSLRGTSRPLIVGDTVLCGFDNGKVVAVNGNDGSLVWEATVTPPHGRTELERLADIDAAVLVQGQNVYAVGFQGRVAMLALDTGQVWWSHELSSYRGMSLDEDTLYVSTAEGEVVALRARTGAEIWRQSVLLHRGLSAPGNLADSIVVGDYQGYVHFIDKASGGLQARTRAGKVRISATPIVVGNIVLIENDRGGINAFRVSPLPGAPKPVPASLPAPPAPAAAAAPAPAPETAPAPPATPPAESPDTK